MYMVKQHCGVAIPLLLVPVLPLHCILTNLEPYRSSDDKRLSVSPIVHIHVYIGCPV